MRREWKGYRLVDICGRLVRPCLSVSLLVEISFYTFKLHHYPLIPNTRAGVIGHYWRKESKMRRVPAK